MFQSLKTIATLVNYICTSFINLTPALFTESFLTPARLFIVKFPCNMAFPTVPLLLYKIKIIIILLFFSLAVLSELQVKEYLLANPCILEEFIMANTSQEQLERWLIRKTQSLEHITGNINNGMYLNNVYYLCLSLYSFLLLHN